jgi:hypothetical protein
LSTGVHLAARNFNEKLGDADGRLEKAVVSTRVGIFACRLKEREREREREREEEGGAGRGGGAASKPAERVAATEEGNFGVRARCMPAR